jgi:hypothetical protein
MDMIFIVLFLFLNLFQEIRLLSRLTKLKYLHCASHGISGETLFVLTTLTRLRSYELPCGPHLLDNDITPLQCFTKLTNLHVWNAVDFGIHGVTTLTKLINLCRLELHTSVINNPNLWGALRTLTRLSSLRLDGLKTIDSDSLLHELSALTSLTFLKIEVMPAVNDRLLQSLANLSQIRHMELRHCGPFSENGLQHLTTLRKVRTLMLHHVKNAEYLFTKVVPKLKHLCFLTTSFDAEEKAILKPCFLSLRESHFLQKILLITQRNLLPLALDTLKEINLSHISLSIQTQVETTQNSYITSEEE